MVKRDWKRCRGLFERNIPAFTWKTIKCSVRKPVFRAHLESHIAQITSISANVVLTRSALRTHMSKSAKLNT
jgi:hypothetical protein